MLERRNLSKKLEYIHDVSGYLQQRGMWTSGARQSERTGQIAGRGRHEFMPTMDIDGSDVKFEEPRSASATAFMIRLSTN